MSNKSIHKVYVLDTTVLIDNPHLPYELTDGDVVIPAYVVRELDGLKYSDSLSVARASRDVSRFLDNLGSYGDLSEGVRLSTGPLVRIYPFFEAVDLLDSEGDNRVVGAALHLKHSGVDVRVFILTTDTNMRIVARTLGVSAGLPYIGNSKLGDAGIVGGERVSVGLSPAAIGTGNVEGIADKPLRQFRDLADEASYNELVMIGVDPEKKVGFWAMLKDILRRWVESRANVEVLDYKDAPGDETANPARSILFQNLWHRDK